MTSSPWIFVLFSAGRPAPGKELTNDYNVLEAGLWTTISLDKGLLSSPLPLLCSDGSYKNTDYPPFTVIYFFKMLRLQGATRVKRRSPGSSPTTG